MPIVNPNSGTIAVEENGATVVAAADTVNFTGAGVAVTDVGGVPSIAISGGGGGGSFAGARVQRSTGVPATTANIETVISWDVESFDVGGWHESVAHPERLTIPSGVSYVELTGYFWSQSNISNYCVGWLRHFNAAGVEQRLTTNVGARNSAVNSGNYSCTVNTGPVAVTAGDYFTFGYQDGVGGDPQIPADECFFSIKQLG
jgi:hypothetical protein